MPEADTQSGTETDQAGDPAAGTQEPQLSIPKWRFDEVSSKLRAKEEELQAKNQLLEQVSAQRQQQAPGSEQELEDLGLEPATLQAVMKAAQRALAPETMKLKQHMAGMKNGMEEMQFLLNHGKDKSSYLPKINEYRMNHYRRTGGYVDMDSAYKIVRFDELESRGNRQQPNAQQSQNTQTPTQAERESNFPNAEATRSTPAGGAGMRSKTFTEMTPEEQEAVLDERIGQGHSV